MKRPVILSFALALLLAAPTGAQEVFAQFLWPDSSGYPSGHQFCLEKLLPPPPEGSTVMSWEQVTCGLTNHRGEVNISILQTLEASKLYRVALYRPSTSEVFWSELFLLYPTRRLTSVRMWVTLDRFGRERGTRIDMEAVPTAPVVDICPNIEGQQTVVPEFLAMDLSGNCVIPQAQPPPVDLCPNIEGLQEVVPHGMVKNTEGDCVPVPPPADLCPNIEGPQSSVPEGMIVDASGNCVPPPPPPPVDVCPNLDGVQAVVPDGMVKNDVGDCVPPPPPTRDCVTVSANWQNRAFQMQSGNFSVSFDATPTAGMDGVMGLSAGPASAYTHLAAIVRFSIAGAIDARNGAAYSALTSIPYTPGVLYHFRMVVNVPQRTYSAYVRPGEGEELIIGENFAFRGEQSSVTQLSNMAFYTGAQSSLVCVSIPVIP